MARSEAYEINANRLLPYSDKPGLDSLEKCYTLTEMWRFCVSKYGESEAVVCDGMRYAYSDVERDAALLRGALVAAGAKRGELVGIALPNSYEFVKTFIAVTTLGAVAVLIPSEADRDALKTFVRRTKMKFAVRGDGGADLSGLGLNVTDVSEICDALPTGAAETAAGDGCTVIFTGGKSGKFKGALLSNRAVMRGVLNGCYGYKGIIGERYFAVIPFTHVFGLIRNVLTALYTGSSIFICKQMPSMFREMREYKPTVLVLVPALVEAGSRLARRQGAAYFGGCVRNVICGGAACSSELIRAYSEMGINIHIGYGLTESANLVSGNPVSAQKPESVGIPYPGQSIKIVDGELWIKGDNLFDGYIGDDGENDSAFSEGWFMTGDLAEFDGDGFLYIRGVVKNVIVLPNGEKITPSELEMKFMQSRFVESALVYADSDGSKTLLALDVTLRSDCTVSVKEAIAEIEDINSRLPSFKRVGKINVL